eukprot:NODE_54_length_30443_cov_1.442954.p3 type:complete len:688 gc:universal NODE_54_length_30443_cov_1.442954:2805-4868(+)
MLSTFRFNLDNVQSDAFVRHFIECEKGTIDKSGWIIIDKDNQTIDPKTRDQYLNIQFLADVAFLKRTFDLQRYLVFDSLDKVEPLKSLILNVPNEFNYIDISGKFIFLSTTIGSKMASLEKITSILKEGGAIVYTKLDSPDDFSKMDYCIFNSIKGEDLIRAYDSKCTIGNVYWLMSILKFGFSDPRKHQFWMPYPHKDAGCHKLLITVTNVEGVAREYIQHMCQLINAEFTGVLTKHCTHLICGRMDGHKFQKALEWGGIKLTNVLWIEDCFTNWEYIDPGLHQYQHMSKVLRAEEQLGNTPAKFELFETFVELERNRLEPQCVELEVRKTTERYSFGESLETDRFSKKSSIENINPQHANLSLNSIESIESAISKDVLIMPEERNSDQTNIKLFELEKSRIRIKDTVNVNANFQDKLNTPKGTQNFLEQPISQTPFSSFAQSKILSNEVENKREPSATLTTPTHQSTSNTHSRSPSPLTDPRKRNSSTNSSTSKKKKGPKFKLLFTKGEPTSAQKKIIKSFGFEMAKDLKSCTHLISDTVKTTEKFLCAVGMGKEIVVPNWINTTGKVGTIASETIFRPKSDQFEDLTLSSSIEKSREIHLFEGKKFLISKEKGLPPVEALTKMISAGKGKVVKVLKSSDLAATYYVCPNNEDFSTVKNNYPEISIMTKDELFKAILFQELPNQE